MRARSNVRSKKAKRAVSAKALKPSPATRLRNYFLAGVLVAAPVSITLWLIWEFLSLVDNQVTPLIPPQWNPETYLPFALPGLGILVAVFALTLIGAVTAGYLGRVIIKASEHLLSRVPVVRSVYSWTRQVFETVLSQKSNAFREVVLVEYPCRGTWAVGFITGRTSGEVQDLTTETVYNVFIPATPNPTTGFLLFIPDRDIRRLDYTIEEGIKLVISGGIVTPPKKLQELGSGQAMPAAAPEPAAAKTQQKADDSKEKPHRRGFLARLQTYFFTGVLVTAPVTITVWLAWKFISYVDSKVTPMIPAVWNPENYLPFSIPGLGLVLIFVSLTLVGFLTAGLLGRSLVRSGERLLDQLPVVRGLYSALKQIFETVFKEQSDAFREVVLIEYPRRGSWAIGFITGDATENIQEQTPNHSINIFLPTTPNPTSGFLLFLPREETRTLRMSVEEGIKMVVSGGIVTPPLPEGAPESDGNSDDGNAPHQGQEPVKAAAI